MLAPGYCGELIFFLELFADEKIANNMNQNFKERNNFLTNQTAVRNRKL